MNRSQSPPPADCETEALQAWLRNQCLQMNQLAANGVRDIANKFRNSAEQLQNFLAAIREKEATSECSIIQIKEPAKRIEVKADGSKRRYYAPELAYKLFRHKQAFKKRMVRQCDALLDGDDICINPYHYQFVDAKDVNVPDEASDAEKAAIGFALHVVNELSDKDETDEDDSDVAGTSALIPTSINEPDFRIGAAQVLSSTVIDKTCLSCAEKDAQLKLKDQELKLKIKLKEEEIRLKEVELKLRMEQLQFKDEKLAFKDKQIAELTKQLENRNAPGKRSGSK